MYTTLRKEIPFPDTGKILLDRVDALRDLGVHVPEETLTAVEDLQAKLQGIKILRQEADPDTASRDAAQAIAAGTGTITDVLNAVGAKTLLTKTHGSPFAKLFDEALRVHSKAVVSELSKLGDTWITILRPEVDARVKKVPEAHVSEQTVDSQDLRTKALEHLRHTPGVARAMGELKTLHGIAGTLRMYGIIPALMGRRSDEYQFVTPYPTTSNYEDRIQDGDITWFVWADQKGCTPGIYTEAEVAARD